MEFNSHIPGMQSEEIYSDRVIFYHAETDDRIPVTLAPNTGDLLSGTIIGFSTADKLARPVTRTTVLATAVGDQTVEVAANTASEFRWLLNAGNQTLHVSTKKPDGTGVQDLGPVVSISGDVITVTTAPAQALAAGDYLYVSDGSEKALCILADSVADAPQNRNATGFVAGKFFGGMLIGLDDFALVDLKARSMPFADNEGDPGTLIII